MQRTMRLALLILLICLGCVTGPFDGGTIAIQGVGPFALVELRNGSQVQLRMGTVHFPDGVTGLLVDYVTSHALGSEDVDAEFPFVWWEAMPEARRRSYTQAWVRALESVSAVTSRAVAHRACLTADGSTLWLHLDGGLTASDRAADKRCQ